MMSNTYRSKYADFLMDGSILVEFIKATKEIVLVEDEDGRNLMRTSAYDRAQDYLSKMDPSDFE